MTHSFLNPWKDNGDVKELGDNNNVSDHLQMEYNSLQWPIKPKTNATSQKHPPPGNNIFVFKIIEEAHGQHSVPNKEP